MRARGLWAFLAPMLMAAALSCGGGAPPAARASATALVYTDPGDAGQWRLVRNAASTPTLLTLDLLPPPGASGLGATVLLSVDRARAQWSGEVAFPAYPGTPLRKVHLDGGRLGILVCLRSPASPAAYGSAPVLTATLALAPGAVPGPVALEASQAGHLSAAQAVPAPITVATGVLEAR